MLITYDSTEHAIRMHGFVTVTHTSNNGNLHAHVDHFAGDYAQGPPTHAQFGHIVADNSTAIFPGSGGSSPSQMTALNMPFAIAVLAIRAPSATIVHS